MDESRPATERQPSVLIYAVAPCLAAVALAVKLVLVASGPLTNPDTYFHLRFGQLLSGPWRPWHTGSLDRYGTARWVPTQWLSELGMARLETWFGLAGVAVAYAVLSVVLYALWYFSARRYADPLPALLLTGLAVVTASGSLSARPQMFSFIFATLTTIAWFRAGTLGRVPWLLVPAIWVWSMLHGMWILGVVLSLVAAVALRIERRLPWPALLVPVVAFVSGFLTPAGPRLPLAVFEVGSRSSYFSEWAPPSFTSAAGMAGLVLVGSAVALLARSQGASLFDVAMVALAALFTVYSLRTLPVAACILVPTVAPHLQALIGHSRPAARRERWVVAAIGVLTVAATATVAPHRADHAPAFTRDFDAQLAALPPGSPVLTQSADGGPMMWTHPELDFPFHGYADVYTDHELATYASMFSLDPRWDVTLRRLDIRAALLPIDAPFSYALVHHGWTVQHRADGRELLTRTSAG